MKILFNQKTTNDPISGYEVCRIFVIDLLICSVLIYPHAIAPLFRVFDEEFTQQNSGLLSFFLIIFLMCDFNLQSPAH